MASSSLILKTLRQTAASSYFTRSAVLFRLAATSTSFRTSKLFTFRQSPVCNFHTTSGRQTASFRTSKLLTRFTVPYFRSPAAGGGGGGASMMMPRFINAKDFHVHVSRDDSVMANVMRRICDVLDPRGWSYLMFTLDEDDSAEVIMDRKLFVIRVEETNEGLSFKLRMHRVKCHNLKVSVEENFLMCAGFRAIGKTHYFKFELPKKTYQLSDVKAKLKGGVLTVTLANLTKKDLSEVLIELGRSE